MSEFTSNSYILQLRDTLLDMLGSYMWWVRGITLDWHTQM